MGLMLGLAPAVFKVAPPPVSKDKTRKLCYSKDDRAMRAI